MPNYLFVMRHAKSSWDDRSLRDHERPLNNRGNRDAPRMARWLEAQGTVPELLLSSSAVRARSTAKLVRANLSSEPRLEIVEDFYLAGPTTYFEQLNMLPDEITRVMVVGHNPGMEEMVSELCGQFESMPTAAVGVFRFEGLGWSDLDFGSGQLEPVAVWRPKEIDDD